jgi:hypothetical protein
MYTVIPEFYRKISEARKIRGMNANQLPAGLYHAVGKKGKSKIKKS